MKTYSKKIELLKGLLITSLIMLGCFILLDLYVPIKRLLIGGNLNFSEILTFIKLKQHISVIIPVSAALEFYRYRKSSKENK